MNPFVKNNSIVRQIWGRADIILFIFAGAAAEFSLNKAVDWLYFTGKLPSDPLGRLFSTVIYAKKIIFSDEENALLAIDRITIIHKNVENSRGMQIPDWAYRDVLYMLIYYSIAAFELLERKLTRIEKEEVFEVFCRVGSRMNLVNLPNSYSDWLIDQELHLKQNLFKSEFTVDLYQQYRKHLGNVRYYLMIEVQKILLSKHACKLLNLSNFTIMKPILNMYQILYKYRLDGILKKIILPKQYFEEIVVLDYS